MSLIWGCLEEPGGLVGVGEQPAGGTHCYHHWAGSPERERDIAHNAVTIDYCHSIDGLEYFQLRIQTPLQSHCNNTSMVVVMTSVTVRHSRPLAG